VRIPSQLRHLKQLTTWFQLLGSLFDSNVASGQKPAAFPDHSKFAIGHQVGPRSRGPTCAAARKLPLIEVECAGRAKLRTFLKNLGKFAMCTCHSIITQGAQPLQRRTSCCVLQSHGHLYFQLALPLLPWWGREVRMPPSSALRAPDQAQGLPIVRKHLKRRDRAVFVSLRSCEA
jgi:hypothetical protein